MNRILTLATMLFLIVGSSAHAVDEFQPISIVASTSGRFAEGNSWHLSINSSGDAELTIWTAPKKSVRRFKVDPDFLRSVSQVAAKQRFFDLQREYGEIVPSGSTTTLTIVEGGKAHSVSFNFLMNWVQTFPEKLGEPSRGLKVLKIIRGCFDDKNAVNLQHYNDKVITAATKG